MKSSKKHFLATHTTAGASAELSPGTQKFPVYAKG